MKSKKAFLIYLDKETGLGKINTPQGSYEFVDCEFQQLSMATTDIYMITPITHESDIIKKGELFMDGMNTIIRAKEDCSAKYLKQTLGNRLIASNIDSLNLPGIPEEFKNKALVTEMQTALIAYDKDTLKPIITEDNEITIIEEIIDEESQVASDVQKAKGIVKEQFEIIKGTMYPRAMYEK